MYFLQLSYSNIRELIFSAMSCHIAFHEEKFSLRLIQFIESSTQSRDDIMIYCRLEEHVYFSPLQITISSLSAVPIQTPFV